MVDPNRLKEPLQNDFEARYQRSLTIKGPIQWSLFPLSWQASHVTISNKLTNLNEQFLTIKEIRLVPQLLASIFTGRLWICVEMKDMHLNLERSKFAESNWQNLFNWETSIQELQKTLNSSQKRSRIVLCGLTIEKGSIQLQDEMSGKNCLIKNLSLKTSDLLKGILGKSAPLSLSFQMDDDIENTVKTIDLKANWELGPFYQRMKVHDIDFTVSMAAKPIPDAHLAVEKDSEEFKAPQVLTKLSGELEIVDSNNAPHIEGRIKAQKLDLSPLFAFYDINLAELSHFIRFSNVKASFKFQDPWLKIPNFSAQLEKGGSLEGALQINPAFDVNFLQLSMDLSGKDIKLGEEVLTEFKVNAELADGLAELAPMQFKYAKGSHEMTLHADFNHSIPLFSITHEGNDYELDALLKIFSLNDVFGGKASSKADFTTSGKSLKELQHNISGQAAFSIKEGQIQNIDLVTLITHAQQTIQSVSEALIHKRNPNIAAILTAELIEWHKQAKSTEQLSTPFERLETSIDIGKGEITIENLQIHHPKYRMEALGTIDLMSGSITSRASAWLNKPVLDPYNDISKDMKAFLTDMPFTIQLKGPLKSPSLRPDLEIYATEAIKITKKVIGGYTEKEGANHQNSSDWGGDYRPEFEKLFSPG